MLKEAHRHRRLLWRSRFVGLLLVLSLGLHIWSASRRVPASSAIGHDLRWPNQVSAQQISEDSFRVASYNIHRAKGTDGVRDISRVVAVLREMDLVALNELAGPTHLGRPDQAEQLAQQLHLGWLFAPNQRRWSLDHFGNGLLSRFPAEYWHNEQIAFDRSVSRSFRNLVTTHLRIGELRVPVFITHLDWQEIRGLQLQYVLSRFRAQERAILLGDLNTRPDDPLLKELFQDANNLDAIQLALGDQDARNRIDWIITRGFRVLGGGFAPVGVSDHPCYWVDLEPIDLEIAHGFIPN